MPKVKLIREDRTKRIPKNIRRLQAIHGISNDEVMAAARLGRACFYDRMRKPDMFRSGELDRIAYKFGTEPEKLFIDPLKVEAQTVQL